MTDPDDPELAADLAAYQAADLARLETLGDDPAQLHPGLLAMGWLLGRWRGECVMAGFDGDPDVPVIVEMAFDHDGAPALRYAMRTLVSAPSGMRVLDSEAGWWRATAVDGDPTGVEAVIAHPTGIVEVSVGAAKGGRVELGSDLVARTATGAADAAYTRLYGYVEKRLLFAVDVAVGGAPLRPRISGALDKL